MSRKRSRIRASDLARPDPRRGLIALVLVAIALVIVLVYKSTMGESTAGFLDHLTHDPEMELPKGAADRPPADAPPSEAP